MRLLQPDTARGLPSRKVRIWHIAKCCRAAKAGRNQGNADIACRLDPVVTDPLRIFLTNAKIAL